MQYALLALVMCALGMHVAPYLHLELLEREANNLMCQLKQAAINENTTVYNEVLTRLKDCRDKVNRMVCLKSGEVQKDAVELIEKIYEVVPAV
jgi:hypothetical protein